MDTGNLTSAHELSYFWHRLIGMPYCVSIAKPPLCVSLSSLTTWEIWSCLL